MERINWHEYITVDPELHHGTACIHGTRIPVTTIVGSLADGLTVDEIRTAYPQLTPIHIQAALAYAADIMQRETLLPLAT